MQGESSEAGRMGAPIHQLRADHRTGVGDEASLDALTDRQRAVLDAVLDLIVEGRRPLSIPRRPFTAGSAIAPGF